MTVTSIGGPDEPRDPEPLNVEKELRRIRDANGGILTARAIVDDARPPQSPLHGKFEWDDSVAAEKHRLTQARHLVRVVRLQYISKRGEPESMRVFHSVPKGTARSYEPMDVIQGNDILTQTVRRQMEVDWRALLRRYRQFSDFVAMVRRDLGPENEPTGTEPLDLDEPPEE